MTRRLAALAAALALLAMTAPAAMAAPPSNDDISTPIVIGSIPFTTTIDTTEATTSVADDPGYCFFPEAGPDPATVWFEYTAASTGRLGATTFGSDYDTTLYVGTDTGSGFEQIACGDDSRTLQSAVLFDATAGTTYLFVVGVGPSGDGEAGSLTFNLDVGPPPQVVDVELDPDGLLVDKRVVFTGTASCTAPVTFQSAVVVELDQNEGTKKEADYIGFADIACPGTDIPFEIVLEQQLGKVKAGDVLLDIIFAACNDFECGNEVIDDLAATVSKK